MGLFDPKWKYVHSTATDIRKTFAKARRELAKKQRFDVRAPKLQLMLAPSVGTDPSSCISSASRHHDMKSAAAEDMPHRRNVDRLRIAPVERGRRIPSW